MLSVIQKENADVPGVEDGNGNEASSRSSNQSEGGEQVEGNSKTKDIDVETSNQTPAPKGREKIIPQGFRYEVLPIPLIMDGKVQDENLGKMEKTRFWLKNVLQDENVYDFKDVFLCTIDHKGKIFVDVNKKKFT